MLKIIKLSMMLILSVISFVSCVSCSKKVAPQGSSSNPEPRQSVLPSAPCIIYKTKADYSKYVPVMLSADKKSIVSYPDIRDVYYKGKLAYPTLLTDGFLLDNRGIGPNAAFLSITYEAYSSLAKTPAVDELMKSILDPDPITEMYNCGNRSKYSDPEKELNELITSGKLNNFKKLK
jgi:hypothetical protein